MWGAGFQVFLITQNVFQTLFPKQGLKDYFCRVEQEHTADDRKPASLLGMGAGDKIEGEQCFGLG